MEKNQEAGWWTRLKQKGINFLNRCGKRWLSVRRWYQVLQPARACLLASLLVPLLFAFIDQGRETLRLVASPGHLEHTVWMFAGMWVAGLASWGWARFLLHCEFPISEDARELFKDEDKLKTARIILRRICGFLPPVGMALGFVCAADNSGTILNCLILAGFSLAIAAALWASFERWQRFEDRSTKIPRGPGPQIYFYQNFGDIQSNAFAKWAIRSALTVSALIFIGMTRWPVGLGERLGSPAVILFAIAAWISVGNVFIYAANLYRVPLLTALLLWAVFCSLFNDNHDVRTLSRVHSAGPPLKFNAALDQWYRQVTHNYPLTDPGQKRPLYLVACAGGGIRAAYWTSAVLCQLEDSARSNGTSFAAHTFALSGVSGGALGEVTFVSLLVHGPAGETRFTDNSRRLLNKDFLAADLAKMAFADLLQRFVPFPITGFDRARSLEDAWAAAWKDEFHTNVLNESIDELYADAANAHVMVPHLLLNGTAVETGQRIITSDLAIRSRVKATGRTPSSGNFLDAIVAADKLSNAPIRLSTAAHQSARFTYFSPAGRFPDGTHVVDGGYFENSGASTLMDALRSVQWRIQTNHWTEVEPRLILISNEPIPQSSATTNWMSKFPGDVLGRLLREALSPVRALLNTRNARGNYAMEQALDYNWTGKNIYEFDLYQRQEGERLGKCDEPAELPLGWTLSSCAINEMDAQLSLPFASATNSVTIAKIVATLPRSAPSQP